MQTIGANTVSGPNHCEVHERGAFYMFFLNRSTFIYYDFDIVEEVSSPASISRMFNSNRNRISSFSSGSQGPQTGHQSAARPTHRNRQAFPLI